MLAVLFIAYLVSTKGASGEPDPCLSSKVLEGDDRNADIVRESEYSCDLGLQQGWYRFRSSGGMDMKLPTYKVSVNRCGTFSTVRLRREHPGKEEGIVTREVCANIANIAAECAWPWEIKVKNCGDFFVYELPPSPDCPMSYCTVNNDDAE